MKTRLAVLAMSLVSSASFAHELPAEISAQAVISDLDIVAARLTRGQLTNSDVVVISSVACGTMRVAMRERYIQRIGAALQANYPSPERVSEIQIAEFISFEAKTLRGLGASERSVGLVVKSIEENPFPPTEMPPAEVTVMVDHVAELEEKACSARAEAASTPNETAPATLAAIGECLGKSVMGMAVMVGNFAVGAALVEVTGPVGSYVIGTISGGWGWDRIKEGCS